MKHFFILLLLVVAVQASACDSLGISLQEGGLGDESPFRKTVSTGMVGATLGLSLVWAFDEWWKDNSHPFHFLSEGWFNDYSLGIDKLGHVYTSYFYFHTFRNMLLWGGHQQSVATDWAAGSAAFFALCVEIGDGISPFGFSYEDFTANMLGLGYGLLQVHVPFFKNFNLKWSYIPEPHYESPLRFARYYDGHTYWLTCNVHNLLPSSLQNLWPEFLQVGVGYGVADSHTRRELVFSLDFNLEVFPVQNKEIRLLQQTVNMFHIPAPALKLIEGRSAEFLLIHKN